MARPPGLSRERIVDAAVAVADQGGLNAVSMRNVAEELNVKAMSLYHHVANKDDLLDELADWIFTQIDAPITTQPWRPEMVRRAEAARNVFYAHSWALTLVESRRHAGPALLAHHDAVIGCLVANGFSITLAAHAFSAIDAYVRGFVLTELSLPFNAGESAQEFTEGLAVPYDQYPNLELMFTSLVADQDYDYANEFPYGLDLILDQLEVRLTLDASIPPGRQQHRDQLP